MIECKLVNLLLSNSLNLDDSSRLVLLLSCKLSTNDFLGNSIIVFGNVKVELRSIESYSFRFNFCSRSNLKSYCSFTPSNIALSTFFFRC